VYNITILTKKVTMITIANQFGMKEALAQLGIKDVNEGTSTGLNHFLMEKFSKVIHL
jgi:aldehyde dehydrogenase (NAD+)